MDVPSWSHDQVASWFRENGFSDEIAILFSKKHSIDGAALLLVTESDLYSSLLNIGSLGDIKRISIALKKLKRDNDTPSEKGEAVKSPFRTCMRTESMCSEASYSEDDAIVYTTSPQRLRPLRPEYGKLLVAFGYMSLVLLLTAYVMVVVHDRVPDMQRYPPLPDLMLDNIPYIPWAFQLCEVTALGLSMVLGIVLFFHKHRFIILRRLFVLTGTLFLLRCFTMWITSLSVPGRHLKCFPQPNATFVSQFERAFVIWRGAGMSIQGVRSCGDYMFSGHTIVITLINFFLTEYTPRTFFLLHMGSWICNIFGIFFILAAHEHYSIDVFIAFYIASRLFLYYHSLVNNCALRQMDGKRTRAWFPLLSFFESKTERIVVNEYEWPLPVPSFLQDLFRPKAKIKLN